MSQQELRGSTRIAIIDDEKFKAYNNLTTYGYNIKELPDITSLDQVVGFDIILCDLMGVGQNFDSSIGGASIIREIKENYPTKFVIAYSGARGNSAEANAAKRYADEFIKKDEEITKWVEKLDRAIEFSSDPYQRWLVTRQGLIDHEVDIRRIVELESAYVEAIKNHDQDFSKVKKMLETIDIGGNAKGIVQSLIASAIYSIIFAS
ncbi:hypothetical protein GCM10007924_12820 [Sneathiella chinensis]|uniref:Response regulatory domain-containing protein n=2 Tax=Sneathiella chinensis TaxID=349750 RepID=A0ABQ5U2Y3_9PROT|nr:hypothetical protein GCM10007924_12820 [Sneathiella chinensis]